MGKALTSLGITPAFIFLLLFVILLFLLYVNVTMKYNRLKSSYMTFMRGKDGKTLEESMKERFAEVDTILKVTKQNRSDIREINRRLEGNYQKLGIIKYDAFNEMGGKLSFALAMLDGKNNGWVINAMHSREGCYTYVKEIVKGESYVELAEEEAEALDKAIFQDPYELEPKEK
ncbi:MAG: DUF4446 family protein [Lachnospiraceae bacterium]|uniref:DUF4446 family protein n=1 Tax=Massilistercora timonensis TaxID=2086584 RepID=UPI000D110D7D|nr:DUF4446 family protein [Massilistercora timonensis]